MIQGVGLRGSGVVCQGSRFAFRSLALSLSLSPKSSRPPDVPVSERQDEDDPEVMPTEDVNGGLAYRYT